MAIQILKKRGNSPAVRLPAAIMEAAHFTLDQSVEVRVEQGRVIIEPVSLAYNLDELIAGISPDNVHAEQDFGPAQGGELL